MTIATLNLSQQKVLPESANKGSRERLLQDAARNTGRKYGIIQFNVGGNQPEISLVGDRLLWWRPDLKGCPKAGETESVLAIQQLWQKAKRAVSDGWFEEVRLEGISALIDCLGITDAEINSLQECEICTVYIADRP